MNKRSWLALTVIGLLMASIGCAQKPAAPDTAADIAKLHSDALVWFEYYAKGDADAAANLYAEDALVMPPGVAALSGRAAIKAYLADEMAKSKAAGISLKNASVSGSGISGDFGWISGTYTVVDASGKTLDSGSYLSIHHRSGGAWPYIRDIWNSDRPPAAPAPAAGNEIESGR